MIYNLILTSTANMDRENKSDLCDSTIGYNSLDSCLQASLYENSIFLKNDETNKTIIKKICIFCCVTFCQAPTTH